jgi:hypothetical protein
MCPSMVVLHICAVINSGVVVVFVADGAGRRIRLTLGIVCVTSSVWAVLKLFIEYYDVVGTPVPGVCDHMSSSHCRTLLGSVR